MPWRRTTFIGARWSMRTHGRSAAVLPRGEGGDLVGEQGAAADRRHVTLERYMDRLIAQRRFNMALLALFGVLGLVICRGRHLRRDGLRRRAAHDEIGVRMALGATRGNVVTMVLRRAGTLMAAGLVIGAAGAWYAARG